MNQQERVRPEFKKTEVNGKMQDVCYFHIPGDKLQCHAQVVNDDIKKRFPAEWLAYSQGDIAPVNGTPIENLPGFPGRLALELKATGLRTVEDMANMSDAGAKGIMGGITWRKKAQAFLEQQPTSQDKQIADLKAQVEALTKIVDEKINEKGAPTAVASPTVPDPVPYTEPPKRKRGRPPKSK